MRIQNLFLRFGCWMVRSLLSLRYRVKTVRGRVLKGKDLKEGGVLFLPNHPAEVDPILLQTRLWGKFKLRPLVIESFYYMAGASKIMDGMRALPVPNFETSANQWKRKKGEKVFQEVVEGLERGDNFLIYPAGELKRRGKEVIGGSSLIHQILRERPQTKIVLVRFNGLWGSRFSTAFTGTTPDFWPIFFQGVRDIIKNGIFFAPKRKVTVEFARPSSDFPRKGTREEVNRYLELWFNRYKSGGDVLSSEPLVLLSSLFWKKEVPEIASRSRRKRSSSKVEIKPELRKEIYAKIREVAEKEELKIQEDHELSTDLSLDSLDVASLHTFLQEKYDIGESKLSQIRSVKDLLLAVTQKMNKGATGVGGAKASPWPKEAHRPSPFAPKGITLQQSFLKVCDEMGSLMACGDERMGLMSYKHLKRMVLILSDKIKALENTHIGIMLPSSVAAYGVIFAVLLAKKIPVMINWTAGVRSLNFAKKGLSLDVVISSRAFLDRLDVLDMGDLEEDLYLLEDMKRELSLFDKIRGALRARKKSGSLERSLKLKTIQPDDPAVILFTSGTENLPKAVPLTHKNLLSNQRAGIRNIGLQKEDVVYGVLPPFHSYGFSITGTCPILSGWRAFYAPDPTDSHTMARHVADKGITIVCCAPSFYRNLFRVAGREDLKNVRLFVSGAEKAPQSLRDFVEDLDTQAQFLEGYGITECSPVVTFCRPNTIPHGVGLPIPGVELSVIHLETQEPLPQGSVGEICIKGDSVFNGYFGEDVPNPFIEFDGGRWYRSGDVGRIDERGHLLLEGRCKRFVKSGGEMVSLAAMEQTLLNHYESKGWGEEIGEGPPLAICVREKEGEKTHIILFTTASLTKEVVNKVLKEEGFARIAKISEVRWLSSIPLMGTGKINYRALDEEIEKQ